ncbi:glycosyltransferase family 9 protein [Amycolatopsis sp. FDAARGOS 1241]|uniref:glycosyltransferase family 9 protein n=1 Tax=Amycolatopsis sp. FDAARGOS 1241 TaxID=2778070 RepID=UPI00194F143F|nr:glycosyltransferase family 9 protein [Amycolatopsis sp. FDAARGOS 1241]QRP49712.1 glycosyltransferase family 9 protein [Amycolatopsis sp. FDAARGOS 1241]
MTHVLIARQDNLGDVLLAGPCVRAVAAGASRVTLLTGPNGRAAGELLLGVDDLMTWLAPWIDPQPPPVTAAGTGAFVREVRQRAPDRALILTSFHQSPLPLALLLRQAGVPWIGAISDDYPGSLLDLRHHVDGDPPEALRMLSLAEAAGYRLPEHDHGGLAVRRPLPNTTRLTGGGPYVVVHPGASVPARRPSAEWSHRLVRALVARGYRVVVTGNRAERELTRRVAGHAAVDLGGHTPLAELASVLTGAQVVVAPNTGAAHLAAAAGTPVVSLFAPVVPAARWAPYGVPAALLGDQHAPCRGSRARTCPVRGHPCLEAIDPAEVCRAVAELAEPEPAAVAGFPASVTG